MFGVGSLETVFNNEPVQNTGGRVFVLAKEGALSQHGLSFMLNIHVHTMGYKRVKMTV